MDNTEQHEREMTLNAHFAWSLAMWGSAEVAREQSNYLLACYGYYYSAFHSGFALIATDHSYHQKDMAQMRHSKLESWLQKRLSTRSQNDFAMLQAFRESTSYLGVGGATQKLCVVRGHPFGFELDGKKLNFFEAVEEASSASSRIVLETLGLIQDFCKRQGWRGPIKGDSIWVDEYLQEDLFLSIFPATETGRKLLSRGFSLLGK